MELNTKKGAGVSVSSKIVFILGLCSMVGVLYLNSITPQNSPKKAIVFKKTYIVSSQKKCYGSGVVYAGETLQIPILLYHYIEEVKDKKDYIRQSMNIQPDIFESQLKNLLDHNYQTIFVNQIPELLQDNVPLCKKSAALTFDDGYEDFYTNVFPILKKYNAKATVYIIANYIGRPDFMNESQINELIQSGLIEIGSHTLDHQDLSLTDKEQGRYQIIESKKLLENRFHIPIKSFAYPYGKYVEADVDFVKEASYSAAVTVAEGSLHTKGREFVLSRVRPEKYIGFDMAKELEASLK